MSTEHYGLGDADPVEGRVEGIKTRKLSECSLIGNIHTPSPVPTLGSQNTASQAFTLRPGNGTEIIPFICISATGASILFWGFPGGTSGKESTC